MATGGGQLASLVDDHDAACFGGFVQLIASLHLRPFEEGGLLGFAVVDEVLSMADLELAIL